MRLTRVEIATAVLGQLHGPDGAVTHVSIDSRASSLDSLFVAIVGERDGHDFIDAARSAGATTWLTSRNDVRHGAIAVDDTQRALTMLASYARGKTTDRVIGVTGSTGKTSTKDLLAAILGCKGPATASDKSFNNELGVPLTLLNGPDHAWATVIEMGARRRGHVAALCEIARPSVGVITNIGSAHLGEFGSVGAIAEAKGELIEALPSTGVAVLNRDDAHFAALAARGRASVLAFGEHTTADVRANDVRLDRDLQPSFVLQSPWGAAQVVVAARGRHQVGNLVLGEEVGEVHIVAAG